MPHGPVFNSNLAEGIQKQYLTADEAATLRHESGLWGATIVAATDKSYPMGRCVAIVTADHGVVINVRFE
jgi:hypothetical protein